MDPGCTRYNVDDAIMTLFYKLMADKVIQEVEKQLPSFQELVEEPVAHILRATAISVQRAIRLRVCDAVHCVIFDKSQQAVLEETINKGVDKYFETGKGAEVVGEIMLCYEHFLANAELFV